MNYEAELLKTQAYEKLCTGLIIGFFFGMIIGSIAAFIPLGH